MEEVEEPQSSQPLPATASAPLIQDEDLVTVEGLGILQKVLFLAVIIGCIAAYLRMSRRGNDQGYKESPA